MVAKRLIHIDIARGVGILLIVLGHNPILGDHMGTYRLIYAFHVPLFFFLSGLFFKPEVSFRKTAIGKADALLKPYFVTFILVGMLYIFRKGYHPFSFFGGVLYGTGETLVWEPLWFLPHLWLIYMFAWLVVRAVHLESRSRAMKVLVLSIMLAVGYIMLPLFWHVPAPGGSWALPGLPFSLDLVLISSFYFLLAFILKTPIKQLKLSMIPCILLLAIFLSIHFIWGSSMDLNRREYDHLILSTLAAVSGIFLVLYLSKLLEKVAVVRTVLAYIGSGSLFILLFHGYLQGRGLMVLNAHFQTSTSLNAMIAFVFSVVVSLFIMEFVMRQKWLARLFLAGKRMK